MESKKLVSGGAIVLRFVGVVFLLVGIAGLVGAVVVLASSGTALALGIIGGPGLVFTILGAIFTTLGFRVGVRADERGVTWTPFLGARRSVPWEQVREVQVPTDDDRRSCVQLLLVDGSAVDLRPIAKTQNSQTHQRRGTHAYRRAGEQLIEAHKAFLARGQR